LKEVCVWQHQVHTFGEAKQGITAWIHWYTAERPHQALGYHSPQQYQQQRLLAA
jgi:transposase InsO family protein